MCRKSYLKNYIPRLYNWSYTQLYNDLNYECMETKFQQIFKDNTANTIEKIDLFRVKLEHEIKDQLRKNENLVDVEKALLGFMKEYEPIMKKVRNWDWKKPRKEFF
jgi:hypothetical protein